MPRLVHYSDVENVYDEPERAGRLVGRIRSLDGRDALVVGTGDTMAPGVLPMVSKGRQAIPFLAAAGVALETFGNHDFDFGPATTRERVAEAAPTWVSANVGDGAGERFGAAEGVVPRAVREVDGVRVGFVGVTDPATGSLNPMAAELSFSDPVAAVRDAVADLRGDAAGGVPDGGDVPDEPPASTGGAEPGDDATAGAVASNGGTATGPVDYVVVLSHVGAGDDELAAIDGVDAVLGGHIHARRVDRVDGTVVTRPGAGGEAVVEVDLAASEARLHEVDGAPVDGEVVAALTGWVAESGLEEPVGETATPLGRDDETVTAGECPIGNLVADAYRWGGDADVGLQNSGGIRNGPPLSGTVTLADLVSVLPFEEPMVVAEVTGAELRAVFQACAETDVSFGEPGWWHGHVSGAELWFDGGRLVDARVGGEPIDDDRRYTVATAEYLLHSDHEFPTLEARHRVAEFGIEYEVLADYVREHGLDVETGRIHRS
jgi:2',3'-cyclic-nucleotide 2'-phosphodiesterase (5'-nucleotidase family)